MAKPRGISDAFKNSRTTFGRLHWQNIASYLARQINKEDGGKEYEMRVSQIHNVLFVIADLVWKELTENYGIKTVDEMKEAVKEFEGRYGKDSFMMLLIRQGAKQFIYPSFPRGRGIGIKGVELKDDPLVSEVK